MYRVITALDCSDLFLSYLSHEHSYSLLEQVEFESIKWLLAFNYNFTSFIMFAVISILELFRSIATYTFSTALYNQSITHPCISSSLWVKVMFAIGHHKSIQTRDCCSVLFFDWHTASISQYSVVADSL